MSGETKPTTPPWHGVHHDGHEKGGPYSVVQITDPMLGGYQCAEVFGPNHVGNATFIFDAVNSFSRVKALLLRSTRLIDDAHGMLGGEASDDLPGSHGWVSETEKFAEAVKEERCKAPPPNGPSVGMFLHCGLCLHERPIDQTPAQFARLSVGWTSIGLQVWCERHECNVCHIDFEGVQHPANLTRRAH